MSYLFSSFVNHSPIGMCLVLCVKCTCYGFTEHKHIEQRRQNSSRGSKTLAYASQPALNARETSIYVFRRVSMCSFHITETRTKA